MGDFNAQLGKRTNPMETATGKFGFELINERGDNLVEGATLRKYKFVNTMFQMKAGRRWKWKNPNGITNIGTDYILTNRPDIITVVTVINQANIGSDHRLFMSNIKEDVEMERKKSMTKRLPRVDATRIGSKKIEFQIELRNRVEIIQELDDIDTMSEAITDIIQQSALRVAKTINKPQKSKSSISSQTRGMMTKRREMAGKIDNKQRIEYAEICKTIKNNAREDIWKPNQEIIR